MEKRFCSKLAVLLSLLLLLQSLLSPVNLLALSTDNNILPPSNLAFELTTPKDVKLIWNPVYGATGYNIYGITEGQLNLLATTASSTYSFNNLSEASYSYVVSTLSANGESGPCAPINIDIVYPEMAAPTTLTNTFRNVNDIVLNWSASQYAETYNIYAITADDHKTLVTSVKGLTYTITNAASGTCNYAVSAVNSLYGESPVSTPLEVSIVFPTMEAATGIAYRIQNGNDAVLTWKAVTYADSYKINELVNEQENLVTTVSSATATLSNLSAGEHTYVIYSSSNRFGESAEGSQIAVTVDVQTMQAPTNLTYTLNNGTNVTLKWNTATYATAYNVYQLLDGEKILKSTITGTSVAFNNLPVGTYVYQVHSYSDRFGESTEGSQVTINLGEVTMTPPSNFKYTINNGNDIVLNWDSVPNVTNYKIYQIANGQKVLKNTLTGTTVSYLNMPAGEYSYEIYSYSTTYGESEGSQLVVNLTLPVMQPPTNLIQTVKNATDFSLSWDAASYANSYKVYQIVNGQKVLKSNVATATVTFTNMAPGEYSYEVHSYSSRFGESSEGSMLVVTLNGQTMEAPTDLAYTLANQNDITLKWTAASYATSYKVYRVINEEKVLQKTVTTTSLTFTNMPAGDYHYIVTSVSTLFGESQSGAEVTISLVLPIMEAPENLAYKLQNVNSCVLTWGAVTNANSYKVYELINGEKILKTTVSTLTATIANLSVGEHTYIVHSVNSRYGESPEGSKISLTLDKQILAPSDLVYSIANGNDIVLKWTAAESANSYKVYQIIDGQKTLLRTVSTTTTTFTNMPSGAYKYSVTSVSTVFGESQTESEISLSFVYPVMAAPENLSYKIQNVNSAVLSWTAASFANSYKVYELIDNKEVLKTTVSTLTATIANVSAGEHTYIVRSVSTRFGESQEGSKISFKLEQQMLPPTELTSNVVNGNDITLKWIAAANANSYKIYQVIDGQNVLQKTVTTATVTFTNMAAGVYEYIVTSVSNVFGESADGSKITVSLVHPTMAAPSNLTYKIQNVNSAVLSWTAASYANSYKVYELVDGQEVLKNTVYSVTATIANLSVGDHTYVVRSVSTRFGESKDGSKVSLTLYQQMLPPTNLAYSFANGNDITLKWTAAAYANSYNIYRVVGEEKQLVKNVTTTTVTFTNMPAEDYDYLVTSVSKVFGESADGAEIKIALVHPVMAAPGNFTHTITNGNDITLRWNAVTYAKAYRLYQVVDEQKTLVKTLTGTYVSLPNMPQENYIYEVDSYSDRFGESPVGSVVNFSLVWPVVNAPVLQNTIYNVNNFTFSWKAVDWANEYRLYKVTGDTRELLYKGTALTYKLYNLAEDTHSFEVAAYNTRFGESAPSNRITEVIIYPEMQAPTAKIKLLSSNSFQIIWDFITYANGYNVYEIVDGKPVLLIENLNNLSYQVSNLSYDDHQFYVTSFSNSFGESQPSNTVIGKLDIEAPITTSDAPSEWVSKSPVVVNLSATDSKIGVANTYYSVNDNSFTIGTTITVEKDGVNKISFYSVDKLGNKEEVQTDYVKIDVAAPVTKVAAPVDTEKLYSGDVLVELTATDEQSGVAKTFYSVDDSEYFEGSSFTVKGNSIHKISFYSVDVAGNLETAKSIEIKIDATAPVTTVVSPVDTEKFYSEDVLVELTATDEQSGVAKTFYSVDDSEYFEGSSFTVKGNGIHKINFYSVDTAGNKESAKSIEIRIDATAPVTTIVSPVDTEKLYSGDVLVELTATDEQSGVAKTFYSVDDSECFEGSSFTVKGNGIHKISFYSVDVAGNLETAKSIEIKIDTAAPVTTVVSPIDTEKFYSEDVSVELTATDEQSGVAKTFYSIDDSEYFEGSSFTVKGNGIHKISFYSVDAAGNKESAKSFEIKIDTAAPVTKVAAPVDTEKFYSEDVLIELTASDEQSGVAKTFYSIDDSSYSEGSSFTVKGNGVHKVSFYSVDANGNKESAKSIEIKIDTVVPVTKVAAPVDTEIFYMEDVSVILTATDEQSGVAKTFYSVDDSSYLEGSTFTLTGNGIHKISFYSVDAAGNKESAKSFEIKIGASTPVVSMDLKDLYKLCSTIQLNYTVTDKLSKIVKEKMTILAPNCKKEIVVKNNCRLWLTMPGTYTVTVTVTNAAGIKTTIKKQFTVYIPVNITVTPKVINNNNGVVTVHVNMPIPFFLQNYDINSATLNGVKALTNNYGYYYHAKLGVFNFRRSDFNWNQSNMMLEFRCNVNGYLVIGQTIVNVKKTSCGKHQWIDDLCGFGDFRNFLDYMDFDDLYDFNNYRDFDFCDDFFDYNKNQNQKNSWNKDKKYKDCLDFEDFFDFKDSKDFKDYSIFKNWSCN